MSKQPQHAWNSQQLVEVYEAGSPCAGLTSKPARRGAPSGMAVAHVGYTGTDDDRDRWLATGIWLRRNDDALYQLIGAAQANGSLHEDFIDLNGKPSRDFLSEPYGYDLVITHNLWGFPGGTSTATACSPQHRPAEWRRRLQISRARYIFMFGPDFNAGYLDESIPGYECFDVPSISFLSVFAVPPRDRNSGALTEPITYWDMTNARLHGLPKLLMNESLDLSYTNVGNGQLVQLKEMSRLKYLRLVRTELSDADMQYVAQSRGLKILNMDGTNISNAALNRLQPLRYLQCLSLNDTQIDDDGLEALREFGDLQWLSLINTAISDRSLRHLKDIKSLRWLFLVGTKVTASGLEKLEAALPGCEIKW
jgi:hypothetical protein